MTDPPIPMIAAAVHMLADRAGDHQVHPRGDRERDPHGRPLVDSDRACCTARAAPRVSLSRAADDALRQGPDSLTGP